MARLMKGMLPVTVENILRSLRIATDDAFETQVGAHSLCTSVLQSYYFVDDVREDRRIRSTKVRS